MPAAQSEGLKGAQAAFDKQQYDQALQLIESLMRSGSNAPDVRRLKIRTLAKLGKPMDALAEYDVLIPSGKPDDRPLLREVAFGFITPLLKDMRDQMRGAGYTALREIESDEAVPFLEDGLSDGSGVVRALVAEGLGNLTTGRQSGRFRKALEDQAANVREGVLKGLGKSGDRSVIPLVEPALKDEQMVVQIAAAAALVKLGRTDLWDRVLKAAAAGSPEDRGAALRALGELGDRRARDTIRDALKDRQPSVRARAAIALGKLGGPEAAGTLMPMLQDPIPAVRTSVALSLGELGGAESITALKKVLTDDQNYVVRASAVASLLRMGRPYEEVEATVRELNQQVDLAIRAAAGRALGRMSAKNAADGVATLGMLLGDPLPRPRIAAARSLGHIWQPQQKHAVIGILKETLRDQDEAVRATAAGALIRVLDGKAGTGKDGPVEG